MRKTTPLEPLEQRTDHISFSEIVDSKEVQEKLNFLWSILLK